MHFPTKTYLKSVEPPGLCDTARAPYLNGKQVLKCGAGKGREIARIRIERRGGEDRNFYDGATSLGRTLLVVSLDQMSHLTLIEGGLRENRL